MIRKNRKTSPKNKILAISAVVIGVLLLAGCIVHIRNTNDKTQVVQQPGGPVTIAPPTKAEQAESNTNKQQIIQKQQAIDKTTGQTGMKQVTPVITYVDESGLNSYVSGVFESGGTCTANIAQGAISFQKTSVSYQDATTTDCSPIDFSASDFPAKGTWTATVTYTSTTSTGISQPVTFVVH